MGKHMANGVRRLIGRIALVGALLLPAFASHADDVGQQASQFIQNLADEAIGALTVPNISHEQRETRTRALLNAHFDVKTIARFVLGRHWREATAEERDEYLKLFEDLIVVTYVDRFARYSGEKLTVTNTVVSDESGDAMVFSELSRPQGGEPLEIGWRVRKRDDTFKIIDVMVAGVSMGQTQRAEFSSVIRSSGGKIAGLLEEMRRRTKQGA